MVTNNNCDEATAASGKFVQGQGVGTASSYSTATYPSTATGTGKILRADGTNWTASTATYPDTAGTNGNVLTSDGTNWVSSAPSGGASYQGWVSTTTGNPADSTTYYCNMSGAFTANTTAVIETRFYAPTAITITKVYGAIRVNTVLGSAQNCTVFIRKNDTTNTNITTTLQLTATENTFNNTGLSISLAAGDFISIGFTGPGWTTNPTGVALSLVWST